MGTAHSLDSFDSHDVCRQLAALQERVTKLEATIRTTPHKSQPVAPATPSDREWEKKSAYMNACIESDELERLACYRENPSFLEAVLEDERKRDAFFRERGIEPPESTAMRFARQLAEEAKEEE